VLVGLFLSGCCSTGTVVKKFELELPEKQWTIPNAEIIYPVGELEVVAIDTIYGNIDNFDWMHRDGGRRTGGVSEGSNHPVHA